MREQIHGLRVISRNLFISLIQMLSAAAVHQGSHLCCHTCGLSCVPAPFCTTPIKQMTINTVHRDFFGLVAEERMIFLQKLHQSAKVTSSSIPTPPSPLTWTYDSSTLGLSFNVCQGWSSPRTHKSQRTGWVIA